MHTHTRMQVSRKPRSAEIMISWLLCVKTISNHITRFFPSPSHALLDKNKYNLKSGGFSFMKKVDTRKRQLRTSCLEDMLFLKAVQQTEHAHIWGLLIEISLSFWRFRNVLLEKYDKSSILNLAFNLYWHLIPHNKTFKIPFYPVILIWSRLQFYVKGIQYTQQKALEV